MDNLGKILIGICLILASLLAYFITDNNLINNELKVAQNKVKGYEAWAINRGNETYELELTRKELILKNDSLSKAIASLIGKNTTRIVKIKEVVATKDTLRFADTVFIKNVNIDTTIRDQWRRMDLRLRYPNCIMMDCKVRSDLSLTWTREKIYIPYRKKFFIARWLQEKETVIRVSATENSPYIKTDGVKSVEIK